MANEITFGWSSGRTLTYGVYEPDGTARTPPGTSLPEVNSTGYYTTTNDDITALDWVIICGKDNVYYEGSLVTYEDEIVTWDIVVGAGEYMPEISSASMGADLTDIIDALDVLDTNLDELISIEKKQIVHVYDETKEGTTKQTIASTGRSIVVGPDC